jgi:putative transposase
MLDILVQSRRHKQAAKKCLRQLLKGFTSVPRVIMTDKRKRSGATKRAILPGVAHRQSRSLNNRCESSHRPTRQRERRMQGFTSPGMPSAFCRRMAPWPTTSDRAGICSRPLRTAKR